MDYYKEEADRAREAAMNKFLANDFAGARKFALKAQSLNPDIDGITHMVATFAMHLAAQHIIDGEIDYYGVLGVKPEADDETVKKRYKKLVLMLHPDKNKSIGAGEAFKLVSTAWDVVSDKAKRAAYNSKRNTGASSSVSKQANNGVQNAAAKEKTSKKASDASASSSSAPPAAPAPAAAADSITCEGTFWTVCRNCRTQYEFHRVYLNQNLLCAHCSKPFIAVETDPPHSGSVRKTFLEHQFDALEWGAAVYTGTKNAAYGSQKDESVRKESTKRIAAVTPSTSNPPPKRRKVPVAGSNVAISSAPKSNTVREEVSEEELQNVLVKKSKPTIVKNLQDLFTIDPETEVVNMASAGVEDTTASGTIDKYLGSLTINVPDSDYFDFNKNRTEKSFIDDQIWASYDSLEGMPRVYFMIDKVLSVDPFKVCITKLTISDTNSELRSLHWLGLGVPRTCGGFRADKSKIWHSPYIFSHKVEVVKGNHHGEFLIYPRTGDVWALYKNWSYEWNYLAEGKPVMYDVVEVLEGYTEEYGVKVVPLVKVDGFNSVFRQYAELNEIRSISKDELSRFSHQIPSYFLTGRDAPDELRGCWQLDPGATPSQLLQVIDG